MPECVLGSNPPAASEMTGGELASPASPSLWSGRDWRAVLAAATVGLLLAIMPHVATLAAHGTPDFLADGDDVLYLAIARGPYHGEAELLDPFNRGPCETNLSLYAWMQYGPASIAARWFGFPPLLVPLFWRLVGGLLLGVSLYLIFRRLLAPTRWPTGWALGCTLLCLGDAGFLLGNTLVANLAVARDLAAGTLGLRGARNGLEQYRVVTPLLNIQALLFLIAAMIPWPPRRRWLVAAAVVLLAACVHVYFFYWTAATLALGGYIATLAIAGLKRNDDEGARRRVGAAAASLVLAGGLALGAPQVIKNIRTFQDSHYEPILARLSRPERLPPGAPERWRLVTNRYLFAKLAIGAAGILALRIHGLGLLWWLALSGYALATSAVVTGLEFDNYHWNFVSAPASEILLLAVCVIGIDRRARRSAWPWPGVLWVLPVGLVALGATCRYQVSLHQPESVRNSQVLAALRPLQPALREIGPAAVLAGPREANIALLWTRGGQLFQFPHTSHSSLIPDREVHERHALNGWLMGLEPDGYASLAAERFNVGDRPTRSEWRPEAVVATRAALFAEIDRDPAPYLARYGPTHLLRLTSTGPPPRGGRWTPVVETREWTLWKRAAKDTAPECR